MGTVYSVPIFIYFKIDKHIKVYESIILLALGDFRMDNNINNFNLDRDNQFDYVEQVELRNPRKLRRIIKCILGILMVGCILIVGSIGFEMVTCRVSFPKLGIIQLNDFQLGELVTMKTGREHIYIGPDTVILDKNGNKISREALNGDISLSNSVGNIPNGFRIILGHKLSEEEVIALSRNTRVKPTDTVYYAKKVEFKGFTRNSNSMTCDKPVIYLYPEEETEVNVKLNLNGELTCTYPKYNTGWNVVAHPDGTLVDATGIAYNYLYWEGIQNTEYDFSTGYCIAGEDSAEFLEEALAKLGLNRQEANEFIVYWLPILESNKYNIISFQTDEYTDNAELNITPEPDSIIRVFMAFKASDEYINMPEQELNTPTRTGFTVVEWGGTEVK